MKKAIIYYFCIVSILFVNINRIYAQTVQSGVKGWTTNNPFHTDVFVENKGQFDKWAQSKLPIIYAVNNSDKIFFTKQGLVFKLIKRDSLSEEERENQEHITGKDKDNRKDKDEEEKIFFVNLNWEGCNPNTEIKVSEASEGYYTFGEKGYENIKANGYKKLLYKDIYPKIDVEYTIPAKGGIKYKIILHPNANPSLIKMHYTGAIEEIKKDKDGNIIIETPAGDITDHAPESYYENTKQAINSSFKIRNNTVSFQLPTSNSQLQTIIIDPWTITPTSLTTNNHAYEIDYDDFGNAYVSGGTQPYSLSKYSAANGAFLWTFTNPYLWGCEYENEALSSYSKFGLIRNSGISFIGEGICEDAPPLPPGGRVMKINNSGNCIFTSQYLGKGDETWKIYYNNFTQQLIGFGGGNDTLYNLKIYSNTNLTGCNSKIFNSTCNSNACNDIASAVMDCNGDFYAISTSANACPNIEGHLLKSTYASDYNNPPAWDINTGFTFLENLSQPLGLICVNVNALALNGYNVFAYDGKTLKVYDKTNGNLLGTQIVNASYTSGDNRTHEGIDVDECNNIYVGGLNQVHVYKFNQGINTFITETPITADITGEVYDIKLDRINNMLYVSGNGFVTKASASQPCLISPFSTTVTIDSCLGNACVKLIGGTPPYSYQWSNGSADSCITGVSPGVYTVTVTDNSCTFNSKTDTITINSSIQVAITPADTVICKGSFVTLVASSSSPEVTYHWNNGTNGNTISVSPSITTTYTVTVTSSLCSGSKSIDVSVIANPIVSIGNDTTLCPGQKITLNATYPNSIYQWQDGSTMPTFIANTNGAFWVKVTDTITNCSAVASIKLVCELEPIIPNIITPNGDGVNEYFVIKNSQYWYINLQVFDRWGVKVHEDKNYQNNWDGKYNGKPLSDGVYFYIINASNKDSNREKEYHGSLTILR